MSEPTSPLAPNVSPLLEADPNSINIFIQERVDEIFNTKPILLNDNQLRIAVEYYRKERLRFMQESLAKQSKAPTGPRKKAPTSVAQAIASSEDFL